MQDTYSVLVSAKRRVTVCVPRAVPRPAVHTHTPQHAYTRTCPHTQVTTACSAHTLSAAHFIHVHAHACTGHLLRVQPAPGKSSTGWAFSKMMFKRFCFMKQVHSKISGGYGDFPYTFPIAFPDPQSPPSSAPPPMSPHWRVTVARTVVYMRFALSAVQPVGLTDASRRVIHHCSVVWSLFTALKAGTLPS